MARATRHFWRTFGPGILFASACIGVSHLVQSTRAGADYGFAVVAFIVLANLFKYPFFEFGSRYAAATGESILVGYNKEGKWVLWLYFLVSFTSMFTVTAAVTFVTAGMLNNLLGLNIDPLWVSGFLLAICFTILMFGKYNMLDTLLKIVGAVLVISTLVAFFGVLGKGPVTPIENFIPKELYDRSGIIFLIALMGWMPTALDLSAWNSLWAVEKMKQTGYHGKLKEILFDFNFGYVITAVLSLCFLTLGAYVMYGTGEELSNNSTEFSNQVVQLYTRALGSWAYPVIAIAAFSTMFSTTITVLDGYGRAVGETLRMLFFSKSGIKSLYRPTMFMVALTSFGFIAFLSGNLKDLVDLATIFSFVVAPIIAWINYKVIFSGQLTQDFLPRPWLKKLALAGLIFLTIFALVYLVVYFV